MDSAIPLERSRRLGSRGNQAVLKAALRTSSITGLLEDHASSEKISAEKSLQRSRGGRHRETFGSRHPIGRFCILHDSDASLVG